VNVSKIDPEPSVTNSVDLSQRVNILGVGVMPLNLRQAVAELDKWRPEGRRDYVCWTSLGLSASRVGSLTDI
jgi:hypothetical protein